jgi:hypothetical protein
MFVADAAETPSLSATAVVETGPGSDASHSIAWRALR